MEIKPLHLSKRKNRQCWFIDVTFKGKRYIKSTGTIDLKLARKKLSQFEASLYSGKFFENSVKKKVSFTKMVRIFISDYAKVAKVSWKTDIGRSKILCEYFCDVKDIRRITPGDIEKYRSFRSQMKLRNKRIGLVSKATINREVSLLSALFREAIKRRLCEKNPAHEVKKLRERSGIVEWLRPAECKKILSVASESMKGVILTALLTGMRKSEILNLQWTDVDFENSLIHIREAKSGKDRFVPMSKQLIKHFRGIKVRSLMKRFVLINKEGNKIGNNFSRDFALTAKKSGIARHIRFHDLRHTYATLFMINGGQLHTLKRILGHSTIKVTERYAHVADNYLSQSANIVSDAIFSGKRIKKRRSI